MKISVYGVPAFRLTVTRAMLSAMMELSRCHYDGACKAASQPGGFLYGWTNSLEYAGVKDQVEISASWGQLDTTLKICEVWHGAYSSAHRALFEYINGVRLAMADATRLAKEWEVNVQE